MRSINETRTMFQYLRTTRPSEKGGAAGTASARLMGHLRPAVLLEDLGNDAFQRRVLHTHVDDSVAVEDGGKHLGHAGAVDLKVDLGAGVARHLAEAGPVVLGHVLGKDEFDD